MNSVFNEFVINNGSLVGQTRNVSVRSFDQNFQDGLRTQYLICGHDDVCYKESLFTINILQIYKIIIITNKFQYYTNYIK